VSKMPPRASGYFRTGYARDHMLAETRLQRTSLAVFILALLVFPFFASPFQLDLACQVFLASIGSLSLMLLTGYAGQISLGHAGLIAAGAFTTGILVKELNAPFWVTLPASAVVGALLGVVFGLPSLRLRGLYLAVSTLALHFVVIYLGGEYETKRGFSTGIAIDPPQMFGRALTNPRAWYFVLLIFAAAALFICVNLLRSRTGRAWGAIRSRETVAEALGIHVALYKLLAFVISSAITAVGGSLFAYYRGFVSVEAFSLFLSISYVAITIIGGMGSLLGALLGATFVTLFPYLIETALLALPGAQRYAGQLFAVNYAAFGLVMILFLIFEPLGLVGIWHRIQAYFLLWPFKHRPLSGSRQ
jgi:branched-chain amino acid transport system permease protein